MGIKKVKIPDLVLEPTSSTELGLAGLLSLKRNKNSDEASEDLSFLESKSATVTFNKKTLFSVKQLIKDSVNSISLVPKDLKYDDSSIPEAPNFLEWCEGSEFLKATPYLEQALAGLLLYGEICPHCSDMEWVKDIDQHDPAHGTAAIRKRCSVLHQGRCYKCGRTRSEMIEAGDINFYNELILLWGQRSGKSEETAMLCTYQTHRVLKMQNPARVYGIGDNQVLQGTFVALTQGQASENLWTPFYGYLLGAPWFKKYHELMAMYDAKYGQELIKVRDTYVLYRHRNLLIYPAGPDKRVLRGRCVVGSTMINTNHGFIQFNELVSGDGFKKARNLKVDSPRGVREVSHTYKDVSKTIKVATRNGFDIEGTPEHPMLVITKDLKLVWRRLENMQVGDWIVSKTNEQAPMYGTTEVDTDVATIMGYFVANGYRTEVSSDDVSVVTRLARCFNNLTGCDITTSLGEDGVRASTHRLSMRSDTKTNFVKEYLAPLGYHASNSRDKEIPIGIRTAPKHILHEFLESYFECDSGINGGSNVSNAPWEIEVGSASKKLAKQLHVILLHAYGILGRLTKKTRYDGLDPATGKFDARRDYYLITITGGDAWRFLQCFRRAKVQKYADRFRDVPMGYCSDRRQVPYVRHEVYSTISDAQLVDATGKRLRRYKSQSGDLFKFENSSKPKALQHLRGSTDTSELHTPEFLIYEDNWKPVLEKLRLVDPAKADAVEKILKLGAHFEEVTHISYGKCEKTVYDITVPKGHAFMANGLASHNTRVFAAIDELGWFDNGGVEAAKKVKTSAKEVYTALSNSLQTVRAEERRLVASNMHTALTGYMYCISSPSSIRDKICELYKLSQGSKKMLGLHAPTWKINPKFTREVLDEEFRKDPVSAERDFGANPPLSSSPFIGDFSLVTDARKDVGRNCVNYSHQTYTATDAKRSKTRFAAIAGIKESGYPSVMAIDAGETNNSFSITTMSKHNGIHSIDCLIEIMPLPGIPLNYTFIFDKIILPLVKARNVRVIVSDRWNSTKILQDLYHTLTIDMYQKYSLKYADFWNFKTLLEQRAVKIPRSVILNSVEDLRAMDVSDYPRCFEGRPVEHFMFQIITVQDTGRQVVKGPDMTDDLWRAVVLGSWALDNLDFKDFLSEKAVKTVNRDPSRLAVSRGSSTGGSRISAGSSQVGKTGAVIKQRGGYNGH